MEPIFGEKGVKGDRLNPFLFLPFGYSFSVLHPVSQQSSPFLNENAELLPLFRNSQEILQPSEVENNPLTASVEEGQTGKPILRKFLITLCFMRIDSLGRALRNNAFASGTSEA